MSLVTAVRVTFIFHFFHDLIEYFLCLTLIADRPNNIMRYGVKPINF